MPEIGSTTSVWPVLLPVLVGGALALMGSTVGPLISLWWSERSAKQKLRLQRFEELLASVYEYEHWMNQKRTQEVYNGVETTAQSPLYRAMSIVSLWFPNLSKEINEIDRTGTIYELWMANAAHKRVTNNVAAMNEGLTDAYTPFKKATNDFHESAAKYSVARNGLV